MRGTGTPKIGCWIFCRKTVCKQGLASKPAPCSAGFLHLALHQNPKPPRRNHAILLPSRQPASGAKRTVLPGFGVLKAHRGRGNGERVRVLWRRCCDHHYRPWPAIFPSESVLPIWLRPGCSFFFWRFVRMGLSTGPCCQVARERSLRAGFSGPVDCAGLVNSL